jgi:hypothetical protein
MKYKGAFFSLLIAIAFVGLLAMGSVIVGGLFKETGEQLREVVEDSDLTNKTQALQAVSILETDAKGYADNFAFWFLIAIVLGMLISGMFLEFEPVMISVLILVSALAVGMSMLVSNMYESLATDATLSVVAGEMTKSSIVFGSIFPTIIFVTFILTLIIMYSRKNAGGSNGF